MHRLVVATHNVKKAGEMIHILSVRFPALTLMTLADFGSVPEPEEVGVTYQENATIKAEAACAAIGEWCIADDAGLEIDALGGRPGLFSKRFGGETTPFPEKMQLVLDLMREVPPEARQARFRCSVALAYPGAPTEQFEATCEGVIAQAPIGSGGFGYDPIFYIPALGCTMAELTPEQKHAVSHRGKVLREVGDRLDTLLNNPPRL